MSGLPPRTVAAELGWVLPGGTPISWDVLLGLAIRRYWACVADTRSVKSPDILAGQQKRAKPPPGRTGNGFQARRRKPYLTETA